ncbi:hypothetical protein FH972_014354 [Carpinus fangiana]|uniref:Glycosyltransferase 2-like domain-containing protein n=1 Tax=Carpinus fangiana TaxID=176857 RepID=A0A5N6RCY6_9ROSI|nr:hypothetical protein FH972_014354 [Carpinus fangiana]
MKVEYEQLCHKIEDASQKSGPFDFTGEFAEFSNVERKNHSTIIKVVWENKKGLLDGLPHLVYVSREKRHKHPHNYKASAMNVLTRVSGLMTNAPYMLNVDCDMFVNNPKVVLHAMCLLLDFNSEKKIVFAQFPQVFYDGLKDDPYGNQFVVLKEVRTILVEDKLLEFRSSKEFIKSAAHALKGKSNPPNHLGDSNEAAHQVASCGYEYSSSWGAELGWRYGTTTEDLLTRLRIHEKGWRYHILNLSAFFGCAPTGGLATMNQQKRWRATSMLEILLSKNCPIFATLFGKLQLRQGFAYLWLFSWGLQPIPELCYAALPVYCIITDSHLLPKLLGISETVFEITKKDQSSDDANDAGKFTFGESPIFVSGTTILLLHLTALVVSLLKLQPPAHDGHGSGLGRGGVCGWCYAFGHF